jgi:hypothetical protein
LQQVDFAAPIHLTLHKFQFADLSLGLAVGPRGRDRGSDSGSVFHHAIRERSDKTTLGSVDPGVELGCRLASDHVVKVGDHIARLSEEYDAALDRGDRNGLHFRQMVATRRQQSRDGSSRWRMAECGFSFVRASSRSSPFADDPEASAKALLSELSLEFGAIPPTCRPLRVQPREPGLQRALPGAENIRPLAAQYGSNELPAVSGFASDILDGRAVDAETRSSCPCVLSQAKPARRLGSRSFAAQHIKHAAKCVSSVCAKGAGKTRDGKGGDAASWTGIRRGPAGIASPSTLASFCQAKISPRETPCLRATSETFAPGVKLSSMIRAFSSSDHRRRRSIPFKISTDTASTRS